MNQNLPIQSVRLDNTFAIRQSIITRPKPNPLIRRCIAHQAPTLIGCRFLKIVHRIRFTSPRFLRRCVCSREARLCTPHFVSSTSFFRFRFNSLTTQSVANPRQIKRSVTFHRFASCPAKPVLCNEEANISPVIRG